MGNHAGNHVNITSFEDTLKSFKPYERIRTCRIEREVEDIYNEGISFYFAGTDVKHPFDCDGYISTTIGRGNLLKMIIEYKYDEDMKQKTVIAKILVQVIFYLKRFDNAGMEQPNIVMVGDINECFVMHSNELLKYLDCDVNWKIAPSDAYKKCPDMVIALTNDEHINPYVFCIDKSFDFKDVIVKIRNLCENVQRQVRITEHNIASVFEYFRDRVLMKSDKLSVNDMVAAFIGVITNGDEYYLHPKRNNVLVTPKKQIPIYGNNFVAYFEQYQRTYKPHERMKFTAIADRLIEDMTRRRQGAFFTPTKFVDYAHRMIEKHLGDDWRDKFVVYDPCAGSCNLTRDYRFKELYCSTLLQEELDIAKPYNTDATKWQMDFLNDGDERINRKLVKAMKDNKPIVFFLNPPYGTACDQYKSSKKGTNKTRIRDEMDRENFGGHENIQHQFMYRIYRLIKHYRLTNAYMALFSNPIWLTGAKQGKFLENMQECMELVEGNLFQASHFADVATNWGISLTLWKSSFSPHEKKTEFNVNLIDLLDDGEIGIFGHHVLYSSYGKEKAGDWVRGKVKDKTDLKSKTVKAEKREYPGTNNGLNIVEDSSVMFEDKALGYFHNNANSVQYNPQYVGLYSMPFASAHGVIVTRENFVRCTSLFTARKLIDVDWVNDKDEYLTPNTSHPKYKRFEADSVIFSLFHPSSNQTSMRNVPFKGTMYNIPNEFFWMSKDTMETLSNDFGDMEMFQDARTADKDRYVFTLLQQTDITHHMSEKAHEVLEMAENLVITGMQNRYRTLFESDHPNHHIHTFDAGYYQLKDMWKEYQPDKFQALRNAFRELRDELRPLVYELGFLRQ